MKLIPPGEQAIDFETQDLKGNPVRLSDFHGKQVVVLYFLRGFQ
jgi:peroxiredoxin